MKTHFLLPLFVLSPFALPVLACRTERESPDSSATSAPNSLPILGEVPSFTLTDQTGKPYGSENLAGRPYVAAFMFTRCPSICPRLTNTMKNVDRTMVEAGLKLNLISISVDPEYDTPQALSDYAKKYGADPKRWTFLTGDFKQIASTAEQGFKVGLSGEIDESRPHMGITHASHLILVDAAGKIRGYFRTSDENVNEQLLSAVKSL